MSAQDTVRAERDEPSDHEQDPRPRWLDREEKGEADAVDHDEQRDARRAKWLRSDRQVGAGFVERRVFLGYWVRPEFVFSLQYAHQRPKDEIRGGVMWGRLEALRL